MKSNRKIPASKKSHTARNREKRRGLGLIDILSGVFPDAKCALRFSNPLELLIATILASQCTDKKVNEVTLELFKKYRSAEDFIKTRNKTLEQEIRSTGFFRNKTRSIKKCCATLVEKHGGVVPRTMEELTALGGVGRKTANVVLGNAYGIPGIIVDTHVLRLSKRMGLSESAKPAKVEQDLMTIVPKQEWTHFSHLLAEHGRSWCSARKPLCDGCPAAHLFPKIID